jgi:UDP-3-O-[3-hydroxymyristoyl] glucosamine N-acyltransferase
MKLPMELSLQQIASVAGGRLEGADIKVKSIALSPFAAQEGDLAFVFEPKYIAQISECKASAVMVPEGVRTKLPAIVVERPLVAVQKMLSVVQPKRYYPEPGVHHTAIVDPTAELGEGVCIGPYVIIGPKSKIGARTILMAHTVIGGEVRIGEDCLFHPQVMIEDHCRIGNRVILQAGTCIGPDGFSYVTQKTSNMERRIAGDFNLVDESNPHLKIPNIGDVIIEDDVELGSHTTIDRATMGSTVIGAGTKIDNLVMIAHNNRIGKECLIISQVGMAGSCTVGDRAIIAGQTGIKDHIHIGKDAIIQAHSGIMQDVGEGEVVCGIPAVPTKLFFQGIAAHKKLPDMLKEFRSMKRRVEQLEKQLQERELVKN